MLYALFHCVCGTETSIHEIIVVVNTQNRDILPLLWFVPAEHRVAFAHFTARGITLFTPWDLSVAGTVKKSYNLETSVSSQCLITSL